jgi:hypothetical protein
MSEVTPRSAFARANSKDEPAVGLLVVLLPLVRPEIAPQVVRNSVGLRERKKTASVASQE